MPLHPVALEVLKQTGPLAVSSANRHGQPSATTADEAERQLGEVVSVYLDAGPCADNVPSTILDLTGTIPRVLREGAISVDRLRKVASVITGGVPLVTPAEPAEAAEAPAEAAAAAAAGEKPSLPHPLESGEAPSAGPAVS
jgi:hypothetical protein